MLGNATDVKTLNIPANITNFYYSGLNGSSVTTINVDTSNPYYSSKDGVMYSKDMSTLVKFPTATFISLGALAVEGDCNDDGIFSIADAVSLQNFLLGRTTTLGNWKNADLCKDNRLDVFDMVLMRRLLIEKMS